MSNPLPSTRIRRRDLIALGLAAASTSVFAQARAPAELSGPWPTARLHGEGTLRFLGLRIYDIRLWTPAPALNADNWAASPLALEIEYARSLDGLKIADRSLEEMQRSGPVAPELAQRWLTEMSTIFPDVKAGDRISGVQQPGIGARFFYNGKLRGEVRDAEFARRFFGIWLGKASSEPTLREALIGTAARTGSATSSTVTAARQELR